MSLFFMTTLKESVTIIPRTILWMRRRKELPLAEVCLELKTQSNPAFEKAWSKKILSISEVFLEVEQCRGMSIIVRLDECVGNITRAVGRYNVVTYANASFLQILLWERFPVIALKPMEFLALVTEEITW